MGRGGKGRGKSNFGEGTKFFKEKCGNGRTGYDCLERGAWVSPRGKPGGKTYAGINRKTKRI